MHETYRKLIFANVLREAAEEAGPVKIPDRITAGLIDSLCFSMAYLLTNVSSETQQICETHVVHVYIKDTLYVHTLLRIEKILDGTFRSRDLIWLR